MVIYCMSTITKIRTCDVSFTSEEDKTKAFGYLIRSNIPFKGIGIDSIRIQENYRDALKEQGIRFA